jgi:hypothetical protein
VRGSIATCDSNRSLETTGGVQRVAALCESVDDKVAVITKERIEIFMSTIVSDAPLAIQVFQSSWPASGTMRRVESSASGHTQRSQQKSGLGASELPDSRAGMLNSQRLAHLVEQPWFS